MPQKRADRIESLAKQLSLPSSVMGIGEMPTIGNTTKELKVQPFVDPNPFQELTFSTAIAAKLAIAEYLARPLAKLTPEQVAYIDAVCTSTLNKRADFSRDVEKKYGSRFIIANQSNEFKMICALLM
ncbi:MAG: hypothetical protein PUP93_29995 [Rhizonema sp. NSF051]|nr:hypothetical protein [Rhizonema sp. NSF051]